MLLNPAVFVPLAPRLPYTTPARAAGVAKAHTTAAIPIAAKNLVAFGIANIVVSSLSVGRRGRTQNPSGRFKHAIRVPFVGPGSGFARNFAKSLSISRDSPFFAASDHRGPIFEAPPTGANRTSYLCVTGAFRPSDTRVTGANHTTHGRDPEDPPRPALRPGASQGREGLHGAVVGHAYRVEGTTFSIEFVNVSPDAEGNPANHIHCV